MLKGKSLIWYNTLWDTMAGGHDDDLSLSNPDAGYGYLIDKLEHASFKPTAQPIYYNIFEKENYISNGR